MAGDLHVLEVLVDDPILAEAQAWETFEELVRESPGEALVAASIAERHYSSSQVEDDGRIGRAVSAIRSLFETGAIAHIEPANLTDTELEARQYYMTALWNWRIANWSTEYDEAREMAARNARHDAAVRARQFAGLGDYIIRAYASAVKA